MSYAYNPPYSVTRRPSGPATFSHPPLPIRRIDAQLGADSIIDAAGVSVTTGSSMADTVIRWGFWLGMSLVAYRMYRVIRYDDPFIQPSYRLPPAWQANPGRSDEDYRYQLRAYGVEQPPESYEIVGARYLTASGDWYIDVEGRGWHWYDDRSKEWRSLPWGPTQGNPEGGEMVRQCSWCKRVWSDGAWRHDHIPASAPVTHGICEECFAEYDALIDQAEREEEERRSGRDR